MPRWNTAFVSPFHSDVCLDFPPFLLTIPALCVQVQWQWVLDVKYCLLFRYIILLKTPTLCSVLSDAGGCVPGFVCNNPKVVLKLWTLHISLSLSLFMQSVFFTSILQPGSIREGILCVEIYKIGFFLVEKWVFCCVNAKRDERVVALKWKIVSQLSSLHFML